MMNIPIIKKVSGHYSRNVHKHKFLARISKLLAVRKQNIQQKFKTRNNIPKTEEINFGTEIIFMS